MKRGKKPKSVATDKGKGRPKPIAGQLKKECLQKDNLC